MIATRRKRPRLRGEIKQDRDRLLYCEAIRCGSVSEAAVKFGLRRETASRAINRLPERVRKSLRAKVAAEARLEREIARELLAEAAAARAG